MELALSLVATAGELAFSSGLDMLRICMLALPGEFTALKFLLRELRLQVGFGLSSN